MSLYARMEHGSHPVVRLQGMPAKVQVTWPSGPQQYRSVRQAIIALVNNSPLPDARAYDPHMSFDRYFRQGVYAPTPPPAVDVFDLFSMPPDELVVIRKPALITSSSESLSVVSTLGVDLAKRSKEVRKLFYAGFARRVLRYGYDPEDVLQDIYAGILVRNAGQCPFDPTKASFGHYIHMVCGCIISNYRRRYSRLERNEVFGVDDQDGETQDVAVSDLAVVQAPDIAALHAGGEINAILQQAALKIGVDPDLATACLKLVEEGMRNKEIARTLNAPPSVISRIMKIIKSSATSWETPLVSG